MIIEGFTKLKYDYSYLFARRDNQTILRRLTRVQ